MRGTKLGGRIVIIVIPFFLSIFFCFSNHFLTHGLSLSLQLFCFCLAILTNSPYCKSVIGFHTSNYRFDLWQFQGPRFRESCKKGMDIPFCGLGPLTLDEQDIAMIAQSPALFARKFDPMVFLHTF